MSFNQVNNVCALEFYIAGSNDNQRQSNFITNHRGLFQDSVPINNGLYDAHGGTTELEWSCATCHNRKNLCPGHDGMMYVNYPLQNPIPRREIIRYLKVTCQKCGHKLSNKTLKRNVKKEDILSEYVKLIRSSNNKMTTCMNPKCGFVNPWLTRDKEYHPFIWQEYYNPDGKFVKKELLYNHKIKQMLERISMSFVEEMGKKTHPNNLILNIIKIPTNVIRPEIRKLGGGRNNMSDITAAYRTIIDLNLQIPSKLPDIIDKSLNKVLLLMDITFYSIISGNSTNASALKMTPTNNKVTRSVSERLNKKTGLIRSNLMGKKVRNMGRSVITGDKALHPSVVGIPEFIARNIWIPKTITSWNYEECIILYENGKTDTYPGAEKIYRKDMEAEYFVKNIDDAYKPQQGDQIWVHLRDGDPVCFNRQPSLLYCSIVSFRAKILQGEKTIKFNSALCNFFNADFDGDEMNLIIPTSLMARLEIILVSSINEWFINYKDSNPHMGMFQDSFIGCFEMSQHGQEIDKWYVMNMLTRTMIEKPLDLKKKSFNSLEVLSFPLPPINYDRPTTFYREDFGDFVNYHENDKRLLIQDGQIIKGRLDKKSIGQSSTNSIFHTIYSEYGAAQTIDCIYNFQQLVNNFLYYQGFTTSFGDLISTVAAEEEITAEVNKMLNESYELIRQLDAGELIPPIGMTTMEYYEGLQQNILSPGDEFIRPIFSRIDIHKNNFVKLVMSGGKGKPQNIISMFSNVGQTYVNDERPANSFDYRTNIYYPRFTMDPIGKGFVKNSFTEGIDPESYSFMAQEGRSDIINIALSTAISGEMGRNGVKNMEHLQVSNFFGLQEDSKVVQLMYGDNGIDTRHIENCKIHNLKISNKEHQLKYKSKASDVSKKWRNKTLDIMFEEEYKRIHDDRLWIRGILEQFEYSQDSYIIADNISLPVNIDRIIADIVNSHNTMKSKELDELNPTEAMSMVHEFCEDLGYVYFHPNYKLSKRYIFPCIKKSVKMMQMMIRERLCIKKLKKFGFTTKLLEIILNRISSKYIKSFTSPGLCAGVIAVQSVSEPITQYFLDSKHRSGAKTGKANFIDRIREILSYKKTIKMVSPEMKIFLKEEYENDKSMVLEIANHIEMMTFKQFVKDNKYQIFLEGFSDGPIHSDYIVEKKVITNYIAHSTGMKVPSDLSPFVIRYELDKEKLILKSMKVTTIITRLNKKFPFLFIVHTPENADNIVIRCYFKSGIFNPKQNVTQQDAIKVADQLYKSIIRGVDGIKHSEINEMSYNKEMDDGSLKLSKKYYIATAGTNLEAMYSNPYVDLDRLQTNSLEEVQYYNGIEAARHEIINNLMSTLEYGAAYAHVSVYSDVMTFNGSITSIERSGLGRRDVKSILKRTSFGSPKQVLQYAAINNIQNKISGISGPLIMGTTPKFGTTYNEIMMDEEFLANEYKPVSSIIDDL
jgi:DNA-directed RNA polymerase beta' subunit